MGRNKEKFILPFSYNTIEKSYQNTSYKKSKSGYRNEQRYATKRYWYEHRSTHGWRICTVSWDSWKECWTKPRKEAYFPFVAIGFNYTETFKVFVTDNLHHTYIDDYIEKHSFDEAQLFELRRLKEEKLQ